MKNNHLSYSQITKYNQCARSYKYHYVDRLREKSSTAFLTFGSAMDQALNHILLDVKENKVIKCDYKKIFDEYWEYGEVNKRRVHMPECTLIGYSKYDFIEELLTTPDVEMIKSLAKKLDIQLKDLTTTKTELENRKNNRTVVNFTDNEHRVLNFMNWLSMRRKAHLMLEAYIRDIVPQIEEVISVQKKMTLKSEDGDDFIGYIDAIVKFKGQDKPSIMDNKTSSSLYDLNKVRDSQQLALYCYTEGLGSAAYAVMLKNIRLNTEKICSKCGNDGSGARHKTCAKETEEGRCNGAWNETVRPSGVTQLLIDDISKESQYVVVDNIGDVLHAIKSEVFPQNLSTCNNIYGNKCPFYNLCWKGKADNLEVLE